MASEILKTALNQFNQDLAKPQDEPTEGEQLEILDPDQAEELEGGASCGTMGNSCGLKFNEV